jgi:hypothetical protein
MTKREAVVAYLKETFPPNDVMPPQDYAGAGVPVFRVIENYVERQLEVARDLFDDLASDTLVALMRAARVGETMRDQPGRRVVVRRLDAGEVALDIEALRRS